jgi:hypothetical protein
MRKQLAPISGAALNSSAHQKFNQAHDFPSSRAQSVVTISNAQYPATRINEKCFFSQLAACRSCFVSGTD